MLHPGPNIGFVAVGPGDRTDAFVSSVYLTPGDTWRSNLVIAEPGPDGTIQVFNHSPDPIDIVLDVEGWFAFSPGPKPNAADAASGRPRPDTDPNRARPSGSGTVPTRQQVVCSRARRGSRSPASR